MKIILKISKQICGFFSNVKNTTTGLFAVTFMVIMHTGCTEDTKYRSAFEKTLATNGEITPNVRYNGNGKAISVYYEDDDNETFPVLIEEDGSELKSDSEDTEERLFSRAKYDTKFIPKKFSAKTPEDVKYAIIVVKYSRIVGRYEGGGEAWQIFYDLITLELHPTFRQLFVHTIDGSSPPISIRAMSGGKGYGSPPKSSEVVERVSYVLNYLKDNDYIDETREEYKANADSITDFIESENEDENGEEVKEIYSQEEVNVPPSFPGGEVALMEFISYNVRYPEDAQTDGVQGRVWVQFMVEKDGSLTNVEVIRGVYRSLDAEAIRVVRAMPKWIPGQQRSEAVRVIYTLQIQFNLQQ